MIVGRENVFYSEQVAVSQKWCNIGKRLLLITNRKSHTCVRLVPKSTTLDNPEQPLRNVFQNNVFLG